MSSIKKYIMLLFILVFGIHFNLFAQFDQAKIKLLSEKADVILTGKILQQESRWNKEKTKIYTNATVGVEEYLKGNNNQNSIVISYPGGEVGDVGELYTHMPSFQNDEEVLVFLTKDEKKNEYKVLYGEYGKVTLITDPVSGEKKTTSNFDLDLLKSRIKSSLNTNN